MEAFGDRVRVAVETTPDILADVTAPAVAELRLSAGSPVWAAIKATELEVYPAGRDDGLGTTGARPAKDA
jgi:molybdate transport system ATP-binding protein